MEEIEDDELVLHFELPMKKARNFIDYLRTKFPQHLLFVTDFTKNEIVADDFYDEYDKTKEIINVAISYCDLLETKCYIEMTHNPETLVILNEMGYQDKTKAKLFTIKERS